MSIPRATYRLQLRPSFGFDAAAGVADYLAALGVSHLYASPYLQAAPGSEHGYDVVDPTRVNRELGGEEGHQRLCDALARAGLGQVLDIVPNHMAVSGPENAWWWDVLRNGPASAFAPFFDVDWDPPEPKLRNQVLLPVLGDHYGRELEAGHIRLEHDDGAFTIRYYDHVLPVAPRSLPAALGRGAAAAAAAGPDAAPLALELEFLARSYGRLPEPGLADADDRGVRQRDLEVLDARLRSLAREEPAVRAALDAAVDAVSADVEALDDLLTHQNYRLAYWRAGGQDLDYRRFFDIDTLAGLRTEDPAVFEAVHGRVLEWLRAGVLDGVRVDHPDGLRRPREYFQRLREAAPEAWIVAEKILHPAEPLRPWPIDGTTGYEVLNDIAGVLLDPRGEAPLTGLWHRVTGDERPFHEVAHEARHDILRDVLGADLNRLANIFVALCESRRRYRDFSRRELRSALAEVAVCFPVYRAYADEAGGADAADVDVVERAVAAAAERRPELDPELLELLRDVLLGRVQGDQARGLRMRFQQLTGPVAAKGEEDTAFYRYLRFAALNEVGGDPGRWGMSAGEFHERCARAARDWPHRMTTLSTHDTKRSEDVRARLLVLAELPERWSEAVERWRALNAEHWPAGVEPDPAMEYLFYQTAVGAWPIGADRLTRYMEKASREAKLRTSWTDPDLEYDAALRGFIEAAMAGPFAHDLDRFATPLVAPGRVVSLAQKLVQLMVPGVPDLYQGSELWDLSLVDPDNRRDVDFAGRVERLRRSRDHAPEGPSAEGVASILADMDSGLPKLWVVSQALRVRTERAEAFGAAGGYEPIEMAGEAAEHGLGFVRGGEVAVVVPRFVLRLVRDGGWGDTVAQLPPGRWTDVLSGEATDGGKVPVARLLRRFPVALLVRERSG